MPTTTTRGAGRIFYFRPGHETYPTYYDANVQRVIANAARWAAPATEVNLSFGHRPNPIDRIGA
jgi:trehalose utilization protein